MCVQLVMWVFLWLDYERVEKSYVDKPDARKPLDFNVLRISPEFLIDQNNFYHFFHKLLYNIQWHGF